MTSGVPKSIQTVSSVNRAKPLSTWHYFALVLVVFLVLSYLPIRNLVKNPVLFVSEPFYYNGFNAGDSVKKFFQLFGSISELREENASLIEENGKLSADLALINATIEENIVLKKELNLAGSIENRKLAEVISFEPSGFLIVNLGSNDGISQNDVARIGNVYVGRVVEVSRNYSKIRTVLSKESTLAVEISPKILPGLSIDDIAAKFENIKKDSISGATVGGKGSVYIDGIPQNAQIAIGDGVIVNDPKVGSYLVIGTVESIVTDPTSTQKTVTIKPIYNYNELTYLMISTKK